MPSHMLRYRYLMTHATLTLTFTGVLLSMQPSCVTSIQEGELPQVTVHAYSPCVPRLGEHDDTTMSVVFVIHTGLLPTMLQADPQMYTHIALVPAPTYHLGTAEHPLPIASHCASSKHALPPLVLRHYQNRSADAAHLSRFTEMTRSCVTWACTWTPHPPPCPRTPPCRLPKCSRSRAVTICCRQRLPT